MTQKPDFGHQAIGLQRTFLLFFTVTRMMPGTGFIPSFCIAFRDFFSLRDCFARDAAAKGRRTG